MAYARRRISTGYTPIEIRGGRRIRRTGYTPIERRVPRAPAYTPIEIQAQPHRPAMLGATPDRYTELTSGCWDTVNKEIVDMSLCQPKDDSFSFGGALKGAWDAVTSFYTERGRAQGMQAGAQQTQGGTPSWLLPAAVVGGGLLIYLAVRKKK